MPHHMTEESEAPSLDPSKPHFYDMLYCPFSMKVRLVLSHHKFEYEHVYINLKSKPAWFTTRFPAGKTPSLEINGERLVDSEVICEFLDKMHPEDSLFKQSGQEAIDAAKAWWSKIFSGFYNVHFVKETLPEKRKLYLDGIKEFEALPKEPFISGSKVGFADYYVFPVLDRLESCFQQMSMAPPTDSEQPRLCAWLRAMRALPSVQALHIPTDRYVKFAESNKTGNIDYDI